MGECLTGYVSTHDSPADTCSKLIPGGQKRNHLVGLIWYDFADHNWPPSLRFVGYLGFLAVAWLGNYIIIVRHGQIPQCLTVLEQPKGSHLGRPLGQGDCEKVHVRNYCMVQRYIVVRACDSMSGLYSSELFTFLLLLLFYTLCPYLLKNAASPALS